MIKIVYRLECNAHFWNFPSFEEAKDASDDYHECVKNDAALKKVVETYDECGKLISSNEQRIYNDARQIPDSGRLSFH